MRDPAWRQVRALAFDVIELRMGLSITGSVDAKFVRETGALGDHFTIIKGSGTGNGPPSVSITDPTNGMTCTAPADITITSAASDNDGTLSPRLSSFRAQPEDLSVR